MVMTGLSHPYLSTLAADIEHVNRRVVNLRRLTRAQVQWKPDTTAWSVLECIEHLVLTSKAYHPVLAQAIGDAAPVPQPVSFRPGLMARLFIRAVSPDPKLKVKTVASVTPAESGLEPEVLENFLLLQGELRALIERAVAIDINRIRIRSPLNRMLKLSVGEAFTVIVRHEERHVQQAERVTQRDGFPRSMG
jgi:hypothetical protein